MITKSSLVTSVKKKKTIPKNLFCKKNLRLFISKNKNFKTTAMRRGYVLALKHPNRKTNILFNRKWKTLQFSIITSNGKITNFLLTANLLFLILPLVYIIFLFYNFFFYKKNQNYFNKKAVLQKSRFFFKFFKFR